MAGKALDALTAQLSRDEAGMLIIVQNLHPDRFFNADQQQRLAGLMDRWHVYLTSIRSTNTIGNYTMDNKIHELDTLPAVDSEQPERRRTALIWVIVIWIWIGGIFAVIGPWLQPTELQIQQIQQQMGVPIPRIGTIQKIIGLIVVAIQVVAAWYLFMLRSRAIKLFAIAIGLYIASTVYLLMDPNYRDFITGMTAATRISFVPSFVFGFVFVFAWYVAILLYMLRLRRRGVLR